MSQVRRVFSGIQPTGCLHLGNYFGAVKHWLKLQDEPHLKDNVIISIVDLHSLTLKQNPLKLKSGILTMTATLLACGIDPNRCVFFLQSMVPQHTQLCWVLSTLLSLPRLGQLPQFKEKTQDKKEVPLGLFIYPVLQSADILAYKATDVPVGEDQLQHIQLAQYLAKKFNNEFGYLFPHARAMLPDPLSVRVKSLRNPSKKMSKSDPDKRSRIEILHSGDEIREICKKSITDFTSEVTYDPDNRQSVANLIDIHCLCTGKTPQQICQESQGINTAQYKLLLADAIECFVGPIRLRTNDLLRNPDYLTKVLHSGAEKAQTIASQTWAEVCCKIGIQP